MSEVFMSLKDAVNKDVLHGWTSSLTGPWAQGYIQKNTCMKSLQFNGIYNLKETTPVYK